MYPFLKLLTGDAIFAQRPLLEALQEYHCDYLFQMKENQPKILATMKVIFNDAKHWKPQENSNGKTKLVDGLTKPQSVDKFHGNPFPATAKYKIGKIVKCYFDR